MAMTVAEENLTRLGRDEPVERSKIYGKYEEEPRQPALDGLRGIAILAVVVCHYSSLVPTGFVPPILRYELQYSLAGVDLFFALSGFLITRILLQSKGRAGYLTNFWARRGLRIVPLYFVTLIATLVAGEHIPALRAQLPPAQDWPLYFLFLPNWASLWHVWSPTMLSHFWSVAVEEQFYLVWPFCVLFLSRRRLGLLTIALAFGMLLLRVSYVTRFGPSAFINYLTITRADGLAFGALAAVLFSKDVSPRHLRVASLSCLAVLGLFCDGTLAFAAHSSEFFQTIGISLLAFGFAAAVFAVAATRSRTPVIRALETRWLTNVGKYSFGIYLFHLPILESFEHLIVFRIWPLWNGNFMLVVVGFASLWTVTYYLAKFSFETFEAPILSLKRYARPGGLPPLTLARPTEALLSHQETI